MRCLGEAIKVSVWKQPSGFDSRCPQTIQVTIYDGIETGVETFMTDWRQKEAAEITAWHARVTAEGNPTLPTNTGTTDDVTA